MCEVLGSNPRQRKKREQGKEKGRTGGQRKETKFCPKYNLKV
jgi:hypothetical protein